MVRMTARPPAQINNIVCSQSIVGYTEHLLWTVPFFSEPADLATNPGEWPREPGQLSFYLFTLAPTTARRGDGGPKQHFSRCSHIESLQHRPPPTNHHQEPPMPSVPKVQILHHLQAQDPCPPSPPTPRHPDSLDLLQVRTPVYLLPVCLPLPPMPPQRCLHQRVPATTRCENHPHHTSTSTDETANNNRQRCV